MFVAASVGTGYLTTERVGEARVFMNPVAVHLTAVFVTSELALAQLPRIGLFVLVVGAGGVSGVVLSIHAVARVMKLTTDIVDRLAYGWVLALAYGAVVAAVYLIWAGNAVGPEVLASALLLLVVVNIRNAWDLTIDTVRRNSDPR